MGSTAPDGAAELERAWGRALYRWWEFYDREYLHGALRRPMIALGDGGHRLGQWDPTLRRITVSRQHIERDHWSDVLDTLRHEMAHQYAHEVLRSGDEAPHGRAFRQACHKLRCDPRATAPPAGTSQPAAGDGNEDGARVVRLVKKLLSLGDSPNENEAQAAVNKAQRLLLEYNLDLIESDGERAFRRRQLGQVKGRHPAWELWLGMILNEFFFVEVLWTRSYDAARDREGTVLEIYGTQTNLDMADYVFDYLSYLLTPLWDNYKRQQKLSDNRERMRYFAGVLQGFHAKLTRQRDARHEVPSAGIDVTATRALVWHGDRRLQEYYRYHNPRIQTRQTGGVAATDAFRHGLEEGGRVNLRQPVSTTPSHGGALPAGRR